MHLRLTFSTLACKRASLIDPVHSNHEPDFLICQDGKWGILEVDGEAFHLPSRAAQDHTRDRLFKQQGIKVVEHFDASECFENSETVVKRFLKILEQAYRTPR